MRQAKHAVQGPDIAIHHPDSVLSEMNSWCIEHHGSSGLTQRCRDSTTSMEDAEAQVPGISLIPVYMYYRCIGQHGMSVARCEPSCMALYTLSRLSMLSLLREEYPDILRLMCSAWVCLPLELRAWSPTDTLTVRVTAVRRADNRRNASACGCTEHAQLHLLRQPQAMQACLTDIRAP